MTALPELDAGFWDAVDEQGDASLSGQSNFGQITVSPHRFIHWVDNQPVDVTPAVFATLPQKEKNLELLFSVKISEFNPELDWDYERNVRIGSKDWRKIVVPSLVAIFGEGSMDKGKFSETLKQLSGQYVEVVDVPQIGSAEYNTIKLVQVFDSRDEAYAAYSERFNAGAGAGATAMPATAPLLTPPSYDAASWLAMTPAIKQALAGGATVPEVATQYAVDVPFIAAIAALP